MTSAELAEWRAFDRVEPFGEYRADLRMGILAATIVNINRGKRAKPVVPRDFMPFPREGERRSRGKPDPDALSKALRAAFSKKTE